MSTQESSSSESAYVLTLADDSYRWYQRAAQKARRYYRLTEVLQLVLSSAIPISAVLSPKNAIVPAILGSLVVILTGLRSIFHWHDDYIRFSEAREAVEAERRLYLTKTEPYNDDLTRDGLLAQSVTEIEQREMSAWIKIAKPRKQKRK
ncbi:DUF4231 domain-containing protein [Actinomadura madurae]|uniref:DUF4231 domain-containing protein n=1 Tax=Actinomadura madurae TaxID=1993 RepID=UPI00399C3A81